MSLKGKVVVITGGGTGMGADAAKTSRAAGASVVLNGRRSDKLAEIASSIDPSGKNVAYVAGDIGDPGRRNEKARRRSGHQRWIDLGATRHRRYAIQRALDGKRRHSFAHARARY